MRVVRVTVAVVMELVVAVTEGAEKVSITHCCKVGPPEVERYSIGHVVILVGVLSLVVEGQAVPRTALRIPRPRLRTSDIIVEWPLVVVGQLNVSCVVQVKVSVNK